MMQLSISKTGMNWIAFFGLILVSWFALIAMSVTDASGLGAFSGSMGAINPFFQSEFWQAICAATPEGQPFGSLFLMWSLMSVAMMAPTAVPMISNFFSISQQKKDRMSAYSFPMLVIGYLLVWFGYSVLAAGLQKYLSSLGLLAEHGLSISDWLTAGLLIVAGLYQFSELKEACLTKCRSPLAFFMSHWKDGATGAFEMGLRHGLTCVGCCWALMLLGFVGGTMNLIWMAAAMVLMILEKLPEIGRLVTRPLGFVLLASAGLVLVRGFVL